MFTEQRSIYGWVLPYKGKVIPLDSWDVREPIVDHFLSQLRFFFSFDVCLGVLFKINHSLEVFEIAIVLKQGDFWIRTIANVCEWNTLLFAKVNDTFFSNLKHLQYSSRKHISIWLVKPPKVSKLKKSSWLLEQTHQVHFAWLVFLITSLKEHFKGFVDPCFGTLSVEVTTILQACFLIGTLPPVHNCKFIQWIEGKSVRSS